MEDDQQATCGHERSSEESVYSPKDSPGYTRDDGPAFEDLQQDNGQNDAHPRADCKTKDGSIDDCSSGHSRTPSADYRSKILTSSTPSLILQQQARPRTSLDDLQTRHPRRLPSECRTTSASAIALPSSRSSSIDQPSIRDLCRTSEPKSVEQSIVRPERAAFSGGMRERGRAKFRADAVSEEEAIKREESLKVKYRNARDRSPQSRSPEREPIRQRPEGDAPRRPELSKLWKAVLIALESSGKLRKKPKQQQQEVQQATNSNEAEIYRMGLLTSANRFSNLHHASAVTTRHIWSSHIMLYDILETQQPSASTLQALWPDAHSRSAPTYEDFRNTLRRTPARCHLRMIFVEDLNPLLIDYLGATFQIPPGVFEKHLDGSGFAGESFDDKKPARWLNHSSSPDCSSLTWFRPVIPLLPVASNFRSQLLSNLRPKVNCMLEGCGKVHKLQTTANILRRNVKLCPSPGAYVKGSDTEYPVAWEERVTIFTRRIDGCKFGMRREFPE